MATEVMTLDASAAAGVDTAGLLIDAAAIETRGAELAAAYRGHPEPLTCPAGLFRKSIALYYYTNGRPQADAEPTFATIWRDVPAGGRRRPYAIQQDFREQPSECRTPP